MTEIWKDINGYNGIYQCSNFGNIRSLDRYITGKDGKKQFRKGQMIKPILNKNGYLQFALNKDSKREMVYVHIIVAETFLKNPDCKKVVNHKDGNKQNNNANNLEYTSYSENNKHAYDVLMREIANAGCTKVPVKIIDLETKKEIIFPSITATSNAINLSHTQINRYIHSDSVWKGRFMFQTDSDKCVEDIERIS
ncbi:MAG TPA: hypothetical protein DHV77_02115 [Erysipelotrichaceae bacterium]|nr:hypothetical protein [Erysipelotrichaceae bacterium]